MMVGPGTDMTAVPETCTRYLDAVVALEVNLELEYDCDT